MNGYLPDFKIAQELAREKSPILFITQAHKPHQTHKGKKADRSIAIKKHNNQKTS